MLSEGLGMLRCESRVERFHPFARAAGDRETAAKRPCEPSVWPSSGVQLSVASWSSLTRRESGWYVTGHAKRRATALLSRGCGALLTSREHVLPARRLLCRSSPCDAASQPRAAPPPGDPSSAVQSPVAAAAAVVAAANEPLSPPPHAPGDPVSQLCVDLGKSLAKRGLQSGAVLGSAMLYEMLVGYGLKPSLTQGFMIMKDGGAVWHVWVTLNSRIYDTGKEIMLAGSSNSAQALAAAMAVKTVRYALAVPPGCIRADMETDAARKFTEMNVKMWATVKPDNLEETLWASAPEVVSKLNAEVKAEFAGRKFKAPPPPKAMGFGRK